MALARKLLMRGEDKKDNTSFRSVSACKHPQSEMPNLNQHGVTLCVKESACRYLTWGISLPARGRVTLSFSPFVFFLLPSLRFLLRLFLLFRLILLPFSPHFLSLHPSLFEKRKKEVRELPRPVGGEESLRRRRTMYSMPARASWTTRGHVTHIEAP